MQRWLFRRELEKLAGQTVFYLDECGVDHRLYREYGRAPRGERIYEAVAGKRRARTSIISASQQGKLVAPLVFQGSCNTEVVDAYFECSVHQKSGQNGKVGYPVAWPDLSPALN